MQHSRSEINSPAKQEDALTKHDNRPLLSLLLGEAGVKSVEQGASPANPGLATQESAVKPAGSQFVMRVWR